jgi:hypothetical protein
VTLVLAAALASGCAHSPAPAGWLPAADASGSDAFGGWLVAEVGRGRDHRRVEGELIAVGADSLFALAADGFEGLPRAAITQATLAGYDIEAGTLAGWTLLGTISTASHGIVLLLTAPLWVLAGTFATNSATHAPLIRYPSSAWNDLTPYARFPQGFPAGLDRATLNRKQGVSSQPLRRSTMKE